jgi:hypothetical protein
MTNAHERKYMQWFYRDNLLCSNCYTLIMLYDGDVVTGRIKFWWRKRKGLCVACGKRVN